MKALLSRLVRTGRLLVIAGWALFLCHAYFSGFLKMIHPSYRWLSLAASGILFCILAAYLFEKKACCAGRHDRHEPKDGAGKLAFQAILIIPLVMAFVVGSGGLSINTLKKRGVRTLVGEETTQNTSSAEDFGEPIEQDPVFTFEAIYEYVQFGRTRILNGERAKLTGQYFRDGRCAKGEFKLMRIAIVCCLADAEPIAILVHPQRKFKPTTETGLAVDIGKGWGDSSCDVFAVDQMTDFMKDLGSWLEVTGTLRITVKENGLLQIAVENANAREIKIPKDPFFFPQIM